MRPLHTEHPTFFKHYIDLVETDDVLKALTDQLAEIQQFVSNIPEEKENYAYAPGKWTIKEVIGHLSDTERIMAYRALRFARKDTTQLSGFNENLFVANANFNSRSLLDLANELMSVRISNLALFKYFNEATLREIGNANGQKISVRAMLYMMAGHVNHHLNVIKTRYLID